MIDDHRSPIAEWERGPARFVRPAVAVKVDLRTLGNRARCPHASSVGLGVVVFVHVDVRPEFGGALDVSAIESPTKQKLAAVVLKHDRDLNDTIRGRWLPGSGQFGETTDVEPYPVRLGSRYHDGKPGQSGKDWWGTVTGFQPPGSLDFHHTIAVNQLKATVDVHIHCGRSRRSRSTPRLTPTAFQAPRRRAETTPSRAFEVPPHRVAHVRKGTLSEQHVTRARAAFW